MEIKELDLSGSCDYCHGVQWDKTKTQAEKDATPVRSYLGSDNLLHRLCDDCAKDPSGAGWVEVRA